MAGSNIEHGRIYPLEAKLWVDDVQLASSRSALELRRPGEKPMLCFPRGELQGEVGANDSARLASAPDGYVAFDYDDPRVRIQLVDDMSTLPDATERDRTLKRYPAWGDVKDLLALLDVQPSGNGSYECGIVRADQQRAVVEGSQLLGQSIVAAGRHAPGRRTVHASMVFLRAASVVAPVRFQLEEQSGGRNFTTLAVKVMQGDKLCASGILLQDVTAPDVMRHHAAPPEVPGPYESKAYDFSVTGRDLRIVDGAYTGDPQAPVGPPTIDAWMRYRDVPADPYLHAALLAQFTGHTSIAAAMRPHAGIGQAQAHRTLSTAINAINISFHADVRADQWMLFHHLSTFAGDGMTHSECRVHHHDGALLASFTVDAMVRGFPKNRTADAKTSL